MEKILNEKLAAKKRQNESDNFSESLERRASVGSSMSESPKPTLMLASDTISNLIDKQVRMHCIL